MVHILCRAFEETPIQEPMDWVILDMIRTGVLDDEGLGQAIVEANWMERMPVQLAELRAAGVLPLIQSDFARINFDGHVAPALPADIEALAVQTIRKDSEREVSEAKCTICVHENAVGDVVTTLSCDHTFHLQCISNWLLVSNSCPMCRQRGCGRVDGAYPGVEAQ